MMTLALCAAAMVMAWKLVQGQDNPIYQCPQCGTKRQDEHSEDCSWR